MKSYAAILGHPVHPMLVAFPIALFSTALLFDLLYYLRGRDPFWARSSYAIIAVGVLGTTAAAIPGILDYEHLAMPPLATKHFAIGVTILILFAIQLILRRPRNGASAPSVILPLTFIGVALLTYQGFLGGELVFRFHIGVIPIQQPASVTTSPPPSAGGKGPGAAPPVSAADLKLARTTFQGNCIGCHTIAGQGGQVGPDLTHEGVRHNATWILQQINNPKAHNPNTNMPGFSKLPTGSKTALADYLASLR
ncbi:MAG TPA: DUF2231 domain-containing protein [Armatimonadota bacterium]|nr:DUF2231 domain-containing protein [Armatimonadota bacterium]